MKRSAPIRRTPLKRTRRSRRAGWKALGIPRWKLIAHFGPAPRCQFPGCSRFAEQLHHILPRGRGGKDRLDNLAPLCSPCHAHVHSHPEESVRLGLLLHSWD